MKRLCGSGLHVLTAFLLAGCTVKTPPVPPPLTMPAAFKENADWKPAKPDDQAVRGNWWEVFQDAQLNALESQIDVSNQSLRAQQARFLQARAAIAIAGSARYPLVTTTPQVTVGTQSGNRPNATVHHSLNDFVLPVDFSYELDAWGRVRLTVAAARAAAQASAADLETIRLSLHAELALDYFQLRALDAEQQLLNDTVIAFRRELELTQNRYRGGIASGAEVAQAQTQLETTRAQAIEVGLARAELEHAIAVLVGQVPERFSLSAVPLTETPPAVPQTLPSQLLERRPDIAAAERRVAAANAQ